MVTVSPGISAAGLMARVLAASALQQRGLLGYETDSRLTAHAGFFRRDQEERRWFVLDNGVLAKSGLRPGSDDPFGKSAGEQKHEPWGPYGGEYQFTSAECPRCTAGTVGIAFSSSFHDLKHGHGTVVIDVQRTRVVHETFIPYVLEPPARSGTIDIAFGTTSAGWFPRSLNATFTGRLGLFTGSADLTETFHGYRRFDSLEAAVTALEAASPPPARS